jgi:choline dehydrogenase-like flavoprotein
MGDSPATSVLDRWRRVHEVENLYFVDGSPFPTVTGANPTLTIMAKRQARRREDARVSGSGVSAPSGD